MWWIMVEEVLLDMVVEIGGVGDGFVVWVR